MMRHGYVKQNFFKGLHIEVETRPDDEREVFTTEDLKKIFAPQKKYLYNYYYWLPRIAIFTGMRLNEICQLHTSDIYQKDSIWIFDINKNTEDKRLKTRASKRLIPIHSRLIQLGFIDFVKSKEGDRVFDELGLSIDGYGRYPSRWFGRWKKKIGVEPPFHSFRHTVINHLKQKGINPFVIHAIDGHTEGDMSMDRYGKPYNVTILKDAIEQLDFDVPG